MSDAVIHTAFNPRLLEVHGELRDRSARHRGAWATRLPALTDPLIVTSGNRHDLSAGPPGSENDPPAQLRQWFPAAASEEAAASVAHRGVRVSVVRLPPVHDTQKSSGYFRD